MLKFATVLTVVWLGIIGFLTFRGWPAWLPGVGMDPNAIGDTLSGSFAPLALLWLFTATMLQKEELKLQRQDSPSQARKPYRSNGAFLLQASCGQTHPSLLPSFVS
jgi:hypothetical protein